MRGRRLAMPDQAGSARSSAADFFMAIITIAPGNDVERGASIHSCCFCLRAIECSLLTAYDSIKCRFDCDLIDAKAPHAWRLSNKAKAARLVTKYRCSPKAYHRQLVGSDTSDKSDTSLSDDAKANFARKRKSVSPSTRLREQIPKEGLL